MAKSAQGQGILLVPEGSLYLAFRLPKIFREANCEVDLLCLRDDIVAHSRYVSRSLRVDNWDDIVARLKTILRDARRPWQKVIITYEETVRSLVATGDLDFLKSWQPGVVDPVVREFFLSKFGLAAAKENWNLPIPPSRICQTVAAIEQLGRDCGWPLILKPPGASGGAGVLGCESSRELATLSARLKLPVLAQKFIQGRHGVAEMFCASGRVLAWLSSYSLKRNHGIFGPSTARLFRPMPQLQPLVEEVARRTRFEGFCGFDWVEEAHTGRYYLIEFHPRPGSGFRFGARCGVDFSAAIAAWLSDETSSFPTQTQPPGPDVAAHYFSCDLTRCFRERDWRGLRSWLPGSGAKHDIFWDDLPLLTAWMWQRLFRLRGATAEMIRRAGL